MAGRTSQPQIGPIALDVGNPLSRKTLDAFLPGQLLTRSLLGRKPTVVPSGGIGLQAGKYGVGAYGISGSVRYDVGSFGQSATFAFMTVALFRRYSATCSVVRRDGAMIPCQVAINTVRSVGWSPASTDLTYYTSPSGEKANVLITNRESQSTERLYVDGSLVASNTGFSGYGSTSNPLCFLGTEANGEIFTSADGLFFLGVAFNSSLSDAEIRSLSANPWQIFKAGYRVLSAATAPAPQLLAPTGQLAGSTWIASNGGALYTCVDESAPDEADYTYTTTAGAWEEFTFPTGGAVSVNGGHVRYRIPAGSGAITVELRQGASVLQTWGPHTLTGALQAFDQTITASTSDSTDLRVRFTAS